MKKKKDVITHNNMVEHYQKIASEKMEIARTLRDVAKEISERKKEKEELVLHKIFILRWVMTSEYGDMKMSMSESLVSKTIFNDDDMITLKGKMMELVKQL